MTGIPVKQFYEKDGTTAIQPNVPDKVGHIKVYGSATTLTVGVEHTMTEDGWVIAKSGKTTATLESSQSVVLHIENSTFDLCDGEASNVSRYLVLPVKKGDKVSITDPNNYGVGTGLWFRPNRTALEGGGTP